MWLFLLLKGNSAKRYTFCAFLFVWGVRWTQILKCMSVLKCSESTLAYYQWRVAKRPETTYEFRSAFPQVFVVIRHITHLASWNRRLFRVNRMDERSVSSVLVKSTITCSDIPFHNHSSSFRWTARWLVLLLRILTALTHDTPKHESIENDFLDRKWTVLRSLWGKRSDTVRLVPDSYFEPEIHVNNTHNQMTRS